MLVCKLADQVRSKSAATGKAIEEKLSNIIANPFQKTLNALCSPPSHRATAIKEKSLEPQTNTGPKK